MFYHIFSTEKIIIEADIEAVKFSLEIPCKKDVSTIFLDTYHRRTYCR